MKLKNESRLDPRNIFIVEDHPIVRQGLRQLINQEADLRVCGEACDPWAALEQIVALPPDMAIVDLSLQGGSGMTLIKNLQREMVELPVLVLSVNDEQVYASRALRAGAKGYVMKEEATETVVAAVRHVLAGGVHLSDRIAGKMLYDLIGRSPGAQDDLTTPATNEQLKVFELIGQGKTNQQIAETLRLNLGTIESYRRQIKEKLSLDTATELSHRASDEAKERPIDPLELLRNLIDKLSAYLDDPNASTDNSRRVGQTKRE